MKDGYKHGQRTQHDIDTDIDTSTLIIIKKSTIQCNYMCWCRTPTYIRHLNMPNMNQSLFKSRVFHVP